MMSSTRQIEATAIVLAAGQGTRMKSSRPKVLHEILGRPMIAYLLDTLLELGITDIVAVVGYQAEKVKEVLKDYPVRCAVQDPQRGTGHAVQVGMSLVPPEAVDVLVLCGDVPLIPGPGIAELYQAHKKAKAAVTIQTTVLPEGLHYGRVVRNQDGTVAAVVQSRDASPEILSIREINTGTYFFDPAFLKETLPLLKPNNVQKELYLTDLVEFAVKRNRPVAAVIEESWEAVLGINSRKELAEATQILKRLINDSHMAAGVTLIDPENTFIGPLVAIGRDTVIYPNVFLEGRTSIGENCVIEANVKIADSVLADGVLVKMGSYIEESRIGPRVQIGPMAHLRPLSDLREGVKIGNFVEVKKSILHAGAKANHLTYLGDAEIGPKVNVGAGTITCNYDGVKKHRTVIEAGAFIGSNTALVAPVTIGAGAYVGAGSTITEDVPPGKLGIARCRQMIKDRKSQGEKQARSGSEPLSDKNLPGLLENLGLTCSHTETFECLEQLSSQGVKTVEFLLEVATPENIDVIRGMIRMEGKEPCNCEVVANLASLAASQKYSRDPS
ncbi:MAG: bifunctional UDP-N-acetylglucosamine diphosphorylase/glucosamine-1-phosphate N-acetyltransferase GlmU [Deltaproteobacteria bacterium]|nr:bifunctional UDP-N-acetylglucosamine diphosphorylase/glucosamine-1-phosphate N-acetyltransferase GlmU [Deltaproteobacteria bacterium]